MPACKKTTSGAMFISIAIVIVKDAPNICQPEKQNEKAKSCISNNETFILCHIAKFYYTKRGKMLQLT